MYVTRKLSSFRNSPESLYDAPPSGPSSGYLVIEDDCDKDIPMCTCCFFKSRNRHLLEPPFPQNRLLIASYDDGDRTQSHHFYFIPTINQPLSTNQYYIIIGEGKHRGMVSTCSNMEEDGVETSRLINQTIKSDVEATEFDAANTQQRMQISMPTNGYFKASSPSTDGSPQSFLRGRQWRIRGSSYHVRDLTDASGVDESLRRGMPDLEFSGASSPAVIVGKWYCPFIFVKESDLSPAEQVERSPYYVVTMEQLWSQVYECENAPIGGRGNKVRVEAKVKAKKPLLYVQGNRQVARDDVSVGDEGVKWFAPVRSMEGRVGLRVELIDRMVWEEERGGWREENGVVEREEEFDVENMSSGWSRFRCYILVERFAFRRIDGSLLLTYDFNHNDKTTCKWI